MTGKAASPSARPPWRSIALLLIVGVGLIGLAAASGQAWIAALGVVPLGCIPSALLLPALRISDTAARRTDFAT